MQNFTNNQTTIITGKQSIPVSANKTGTISTVGTAVVGVGTKFITEMPPGSFVVDLNAWELRRVASVSSDTLAYLVNAFSVDISAGTTPNLIHAALPFPARPAEIAISIDGANPNGLLFNQSFGGELDLSKAQRDRSSASDRVDPIIVDATGTFMNVLVIY